jgi:uncharacterized protein (DUF736 family)
MMTIQEIEAACDASQPFDFTRHELQGPELALRKMFYPLGFPAEVRTNSPEILSLYEEYWGMLEGRFETEPIRIDIRLTETTSTECPPAPTYRMMAPLMIGAADADNYSIVDLERGHTYITVTRATLAHQRYLRDVFLVAATGCHIATRHATPIHAGCVGLNEHGVLLCGDSGAGKSSLSYACARAGFTYVADDASFILNQCKNRVAIGNHHSVRLRPSAAALFPEINRLKMTPRLSGKPSIEMRTASLPNITTAHCMKVDYMVFLNRRAGGPPELRPYRKDVARQFMRQMLYGSPESLAVQYESIERLLAVEVLELRYTAMDWAIHRLQRLLREGL